MGSFISGRVTSSMLANNYLSGMNRNLSNLQTINNQLTTGKEVTIHQGSPYKSSRTMQLYSTMGANKQYNENIKDTQNWLDSTDTALGQVTSVFQRVRELMVAAGNAAYGTKERTNIQNEVNERIGELGQILNTSFDGRYIFGGTKVTSKPVYIDKSSGETVLNYSDANGNKVDYNDMVSSGASNALKELNLQLNSDLTTEVSQGVTVDYNVTATSLLNFSTGKYVKYQKTGSEYTLDADGNRIPEKNADGSIKYYSSSDPDVDKETINAIGLLKSIVNNIAVDETASPANAQKLKQVTTTNLADFDKVIDNLLKIRAEVGAKSNRMETAKSQNEDDNLNMTDILSKTEDIDWSEKTIEYYMARTVYQASLQVSAQVLPQTLLDYL